MLRIATIVCYKLLDSRIRHWELLVNGTLAHCSVSDCHRQQQILAELKVFSPRQNGTAARMQSRAKSFCLSLVPTFALH